MVGNDGTACHKTSSGTSPARFRSTSCGMPCRRSRPSARYGSASSRPTDCESAAVMPDVSFVNLFIVCLVAAAAPLLLGLAPRLRLPSVILEIVAGIVLGPSVLGWVKIDLPVQILALIGLAFLLFLSGLEIDAH